MTIDFKWEGLPRRMIANRTWNTSERTRANWIRRLDEAPHAIICFDMEERSVTLRMMSTVDNVEYCAAIQIEISDFAYLYDSISSFYDPL